MAEKKDLSGGEKSAAGIDKKDQLLQISPANELRFQGPFNHAITSHMRLSNPTEETILFKIKTTAPKKYCVRPNCGTLTPNGTVEVSICLQPFVFDPSEKNKHKFMVQSLVALKDVPFEQQWKEIGPAELMDTKLRCVFVMPAETQAEPQALQVQAKASPSNKATTGDTAAQSDYVYTEAITQTQVTSENEQAAMANELKQLRSETLKLRMDLVNSQEEVQRLRDAGTAFQNPYQPPQQVQQSPTAVLFVAVALVIAILSALLGKYVF